MCENTELEPIVKDLSNTLFQNEHWSFQQDSAPAHKAKSTQGWLECNVPDFISTSEYRLLARTSILWITNCGQCLRAFSAGRGTPQLQV